MGRQEFSGTVIIQQSTTLAGQGVFNRIGVGITAVELKIGANALTSRSNIYIQSDPNNTDKIYIGIDNTVSLTKWFAVLTPGSSYTIELEPSKTLKVWAISGTASQNVGLLEVAN